MSVTVYAFELYDPVRRAWSRAPGLATLEAIERMGGVAIRRSAVHVEAAQLDADGRLMTRLAQEK